MRFWHFERVSPLLLSGGIRPMSPTLLPAFDDNSPPSPSPGDLVAGKYLVARRLGEGGMGLVFEAVHRKLEQRVAIKFLHPTVLATSGAVARFEREARAAARIRSPHVARVLDVDTTSEGVPYIVMELLVGRDLESEIRARGPLPVAEAVGYVLEACTAAEAAHAASVVHGDLKPANLFLAVEGGRRVIKVLDFGISRLVEEPAQAEKILGTPVYMSPEQVRGASDVDGRSDIWSLGVILYELLAGEPPFHGATTAAIAAILADTTPRVRAARPEVPQALERVLAKALASDRASRFPNVQAFAAALAPFAVPARRVSWPPARAGIVGTASLPALEIAPRLAESGVAHGSRRRWRAAAAAVAMGVVAAGTILTARSFAGAEPAAAAALPAARRILQCGPARSDAGAPETGACDLEGVPEGRGGEVLVDDSRPAHERDVSRSVQSRAGSLERLVALGRDEPPARDRMAIEPEEHPVVDRLPGLVGELLGGDEDGPPPLRPRRLQHRSVAAPPARTHLVVGAALEEAHGPAEAVRVERVPIGQDEVDGAEVLARPRVVRRLLHRGVGRRRGGCVGDAGFVEAREEVGEEELTVGLPLDGEEALAGRVRTEEGEVFHRAVVREHPAAALERVGVLQRRETHGALADVRDEELAFAPHREPVILGVLRRASRPFVKAPALVVHSEPPAVAVLARESGQAARRLTEDDAKLGGFGSDDTKQAAHQESCAWILLNGGEPGQSRPCRAGRCGSGGVGAAAHRGRDHIFG